MKLLVTGVCGQLGHDVVNEASKRKHECIGPDITEKYSGVADGTAVTEVTYVQLDITDKSAVDKVIREFHPDAIIHCAAWTAVDAVRGKMILPSHGKEFFTSYGKHFFTRFGKQIFT